MSRKLAVARGGPIFAVLTVAACVGADPTASAPDVDVVRATDGGTSAGGGDSSSGSPGAVDAGGGAEAGQPVVPAKLTAPTSVDFGDVPKDAPVDRVVTIGNGGNVPTSSSVSTSVTGDYVVVENTCTSPVAPGDDVCTVTVRIVASTLGPQTGTLTLDAGDTTASVELVAQSKAPALITPALSGAGYPLRGNVGVGGAKTYRYTLHNTGAMPTSPVAITTTIGAGWNISVNTCEGVVLQPEATCDLHVQFAPASVGGPIPYTVTISGGATPRSLAFSDTATAFCSPAGSSINTNEWCSVSQGRTPKGGPSAFCSFDFECLNGCDEDQGRCF